ncbi:hypothetical protein CRM22_003220, partial [Opisthorchis felineus]
KPVIKEALKYLPEDSIFLTVLVGDRTAWRSPSNVFRTNSNCAISSIPTLIEFGTAKRLSGENILNPALIQLLFEKEA